MSVHGSGKGSLPPSCISTLQCPNRVRFIRLSPSSTVSFFSNTLVGQIYIFFALGGSPRHQQGASSRRVIRMQSSPTTLRRDPHFAPPTRGLSLVVRLLHSDAKYFCTEPPPLLFSLPPPASVSFCCRLFPLPSTVSGYFLLSSVGTSTGRVYPTAATFRPQLQPGRAPGRLLHQGQADHYYEASAPG